jgi:multidrug efflux pump subunit AcrA (membrane-fusion protein)
MKMILLAASGFIVGILAGWKLALPAADAPAGSRQVRFEPREQVAWPASAAADAPAAPASPQRQLEEDRGGVPPAVDAPAASAPPRATVPLEVPGRTRCMLARRGIIASAILRPVVEVLVSPGDQVTRGQVLVKLFDLEPQAKVRARENELRSAEARAQASRRNLELAERSQQTGAIPQTTYNELRGTALSNEALVLAAQAELAHARSELKLYSITASMDGEVAWLDVSPGTVSWPGSLIWGEIVDLRELDVRCELTPAQAEQIALGQSAEVQLDGRSEVAGAGKVVLVGHVADRNSGYVPVVVRVANAQLRLRAEVAVKVRFRIDQAN